MERSWSEAAATAFDAYPWTTPCEKARAREEAELVSFGECVEVDDLPLAVRRWLRTRRQSENPGVWTWKGESWQELVEGFERAILTQALEASNGFVARAARALRTTPRIVAYKARKYGLIDSTNSQHKEHKTG